MKNGKINIDKNIKLSSSIIAGALLAYVAISSLIYLYFSVKGPGFFGDANPVLVSENYWKFILLAISSGFLSYSLLTNAKRAVIIASSIPYTTLIAFFLVILPVANFETIETNLYHFQTSPFIPNIFLWTSVVLTWCAVIFRANHNNKRQI